LELLSPLKIGKVYTDGNDAYDERFDSETLAVSKKNTQKIERKHLSRGLGAADWFAKAYAFQRRSVCTKFAQEWSSTSGFSDAIVLFNEFETRPVFIYPYILLPACEKQSTIFQNKF
jgi:hypothetical protein